MKKIFFNSSLLLLSFIVIDHLLVMFSFVSSSNFLPWVLPVSLLFSVLMFLFMENKSSIRLNLWSLLLSFLVIIVSMALAVFYVDFSWDGQWYHQSAIYNMVEGWNPLKEAIREFEIHNSVSIAHFPKAAWYYAASVYSFSGVFEAGKSINFILLFVAFFLLYYTLRKYDLPVGRSLFASLLLVLNPVVWSEITTYLNDGSLVLYLSIYVTMLFAWFKTPGKKVFLMGAFAIIGLVNLKFTGLVFFCVLALFFCVYLLFFKRELVLKALLSHGIVLLLALVLFGFNPYVSNYIERGHPLYPIFGTSEYPSVFDQTGKDDNEIHETPHNLRGKALIVRMFYANFGRPDNAPYYKEKEAKLILPFTSSFSDWKAYYFHETRVSGFGPYFGVCLVISLFMLVGCFFVDRKKAWIAFIAVSALISTLLFSKHFWWPRFAPQTWLIPLVPYLFLLSQGKTKKLLAFNRIFALLLLINGGIVLFFHMNWETRSSIELRKQLSELSEKKVPVEIFYGWFKKSMEMKLSYWQIEYRSLSKKPHNVEAYKKLPSVVEGYPNMVLYREFYDSPRNEEIARISRKQ